MHSHWSLVDALIRWGAPLSNPQTTTHHRTSELRYDGTLHCLSGDNMTTSSVRSSACNHGLIARHYLAPLKFPATPWSWFMADFKNAGAMKVSCHAMHLQMADDSLINIAQNRDTMNLAPMKYMSMAFEALFCLCTVTSKQSWLVADRHHHVMPESRHIAWLVLAWLAWLSYVKSGPKRSNMRFRSPSAECRVYSKILKEYNAVAKAPVNSLIDNTACDSLALITASYQQEQPNTFLVCNFQPIAPKHAQHVPLRRITIAKAMFQSRQTRISPCSFRWDRQAHIPSNHALNLPTESACWLPLSDSHANLLTQLCRRQWIADRQISNCHHHFANNDYYEEISRLSGWISHCVIIAKWWYQMRQQPNLYLSWALLSTARQSSLEMPCFLTQIHKQIHFASQWLFDFRRRENTNCTHSLHHHAYRTDWPKIVRIEKKNVVGWKSHLKYSPSSLYHFRAYYYLWIWGHFWKFFQGNSRGPCCLT